MLETLRYHIAIRLQRLSVRLQRAGTVKHLPHGPSATSPVC